MSVLAILVKSIPGACYELHSEWPATAHGDHRRILDALADGDADRARSEIERHFAHAADRVVAYLEKRRFWAG